MHTATIDEQSRIHAPASEWALAGEDGGAAALTGRRRSYWA